MVRPSLTLESGDGNLANFVGLGLVLGADVVGDATIGVCGDDEFEASEVGEPVVTGGLVRGGGVGGGGVVGAGVEIEGVVEGGRAGVAREVTLFDGHGVNSGRCEYFAQFIRGGDFSSNKPGFRCPFSAKMTEKHEHDKD